MAEKDQAAAMSIVPASAVSGNGANGNGNGDGANGGMSSEASFFEALEKAGLELRMKDLQIYAGGLKKGDWDVGLTVDVIRMMPFLDVIILVTGDGDYIPLGQLRKMGRWASGRDRLVPKECINKACGGRGRVREYRGASARDHEAAVHGTGEAAAVG